MHRHSPLTGSRRDDRLAARLLEPEDVEAVLAGYVYDEDDEDEEGDEDNGGAAS